MMTPKLEHKARVAKHIFPNVVKDVDGYYVYFPSGDTGAWTANDLKVIAQLLDEANRLWNIEVAVYFALQG